jgi:hypothetical protein
MSRVPPGRRLRPSSSIVPDTPPPIQVAPQQAATSTGVSATKSDASACTKRTWSATPSSAARDRAAARNTVLMSTPVPVTWWSRAQVHNSSPLPLARSSTDVPGPSCSARPSVASFSSVNGLMIR